MRVPVLTYHATNIAGNEYHNNDLVAFAQDLRAITDRGLRIVPLHWVVDAMLGRNERDLNNCVALSCDDGPSLDFYDVEHPAYGPQRSLYNCLLDFRNDYGAGAQPDLQLTSFVIAAPAARDELDRTCLDNRGWMREDWWREAQLSGLISIENHSWDHNHPCLPDPGPHDIRRGDFHQIANRAQAEYEITQAQDYLIERLAPHRPRLFCYPFSHVNDYLSREWLPTRGVEIGLDAAFGDGAAPVSAESNRWNVPRYICGWHWKTPEELSEILGRAAH